jgi:hypothetical protein
MAIDVIEVEVTPLAETIEVQVPGIPGPKGDPGDVAAQAQLDALDARSTALEGQSGSVTIAAADDFRSDYESVTLSPAMPDTDYVILTDVSDPELMGDAVAYDLATNGFKLRVTGSGGGTVTWRLLPL